MAEIIAGSQKEGDSSAAVQENGVSPNNHGPSNRKEKRKEAKKLKRKQLRKDLAVKEREEEEARLNDPEEQVRLRLKEQEEAERAEKEKRLFDEREATWLEAARKAKEEAERNLLEESQGEPVKCENELNEDDSWEYIEEGPAEIIWQGNEIIVKKKKVRIPKRSVDQQADDEIASRPTSNPLPPQSAAFDDYRKANDTCMQALFESVAQQTPNFGTEQDKAHCPFHFKTGACRFGSRCSRVHFYPDKSCTLLIKNMYNGPGLAWEQDEGLEYTEEEVERCFEEFYEDVHTEFLKYGQIVNFKVCRNGSSHLRGNVYVHYKHLESAVLAYNSLNGRFFAGKQITCEFVGVTRWRVAICGEYMKSRHKTCSRGSTCNFIHCFRNPGGDYEWADWDKLPPKYWVEKMVALFGPSARDEDEEKEKCEELETPKKIPRDSRHHLSRFKSRDRHNVNGDSSTQDWCESGRFHHLECSRRTDYRHSRSRYDKTYDDKHMDDHERFHRFPEWSGSSDSEHSDSSDSFSDYKDSKREAYSGHGQHSSRGIEAYHTDCEHTCDLGYLDSDTENDYSDKYSRHSRRAVYRHHRRNGSTQREESLKSDYFDHSPKKGFSCKNRDKIRGYPEEDGHSSHIDDHWSRKEHHRSHGSSRRNETCDTEEHSERWSCNKSSSDATRCGSPHANNVTSNVGHHKNVYISKDYAHPDSIHDRIVSSERKQSRDDTGSPDDTHHERHYQKHFSSSGERKRKRAEASRKKRNDDIEDLDDLKREKRSSRRDKTACGQENPDAVRNEQLLRKSSKRKHRRHAIDEDSEHLIDDYSN
ncbi:zinc finger CCCH domain-containing protein 5 isoform X2 [Nymphaea colorata]|nr:zinc finger CCCH domain-containing protein 5 isoform X2 [Nymphaea colorata]